jgi:hypothetical protein
MTGEAKQSPGCPGPIDASIVHPVRESKKESRSGVRATVAHLVARTTRPAIVEANQRES